MSPLEREITQLWGQITAATHRFLTLVAEFDETEGWSGAGIVSCAHWLNVFCGIGQVAAREKVRVARALRQLPQIDAAFGEGRVSYSKVRAMTRVATPENEAILLNIAIHGTAAHVERTVRGFRKVERLEEAQAAAAAHRNRFVELRHDDEHIVIHGRLPVEVGELVWLAIERAMELGDTTAALGDDSAESSYESNQASSRAWSEGVSEPTGVTQAADAAEATEAIQATSDAEPIEPEDDESIGARRADALCVMAQQFLANAESASASASDRYQVVVHIDQRSLSGGASQGSVLSEIEDGPALAVETARRLACDASLVGLVANAQGEPLDLGRKTRAISLALKRALKVRDPCCRFPGCSRTRYTEAHHIEHWAIGGGTKLSNLITLCYFHHQLVHEGGYSVTRTDDGLFVFRYPDGSRVRDSFAVDGCFRGSAITELNWRRGFQIEPDTIRTRWLGETMDYSLAMDALLQAREQARAQQEPWDPLPP
jgi:hypothetical protein